MTSRTRAYMSDYDYTYIGINTVMYYMHPAQAYLLPHVPRDGLHGQGFKLHASMYTCDPVLFYRFIPSTIMPLERAL